MDAFLSLVTLHSWSASVLIQGLAYLDPGSGSVILQILLGALLGGLFLIKTYWRKITGFFRSRSSSRKEDHQE